MSEHAHYKNNREKSKHPRREQYERRVFKEELRSFSRKPINIRMLPHFCKKDTMHVCTACDSTDRQKSCHFFLPATGCPRCMELRFEEYCGSITLHRYLDGSFSDSRAELLMKREKTRLAKIQNRAEGYTVDFPLEGEETKADVHDVYDQLVGLGMTQPEFWVDQYGKCASEHEFFSVTVDDLKNGVWIPKRKELKKDILKFFELKEKFKV